MSAEQQGQFERDAPRPRHGATGQVARTSATSAEGPSDRSTRFLARLDSHLSTLADRTARRAFLDRQLEGWQRRYGVFIATGGESEPVVIPFDSPQAADFLLTITGLMARRRALDKQTRVHA